MQAFTGQSIKTIFFRISPGDHPLTKKPEDSGYEIVSGWKPCLSGYASHGFVVPFCIIPFGPIILFLVFLFCSCNYFDVSNKADKYNRINKSNNGANRNGSNNTTLIHCSSRPDREFVGRRVEDQSNPWNLQVSNFYFPFWFERFHQILQHEYVIQPQRAIYIIIGSSGSSVFFQKIMKVNSTINASPTCKKLISNNNFLYIYIYVWCGLSQTQDCRNFSTKGSLNYLISEGVS